MKARDDCATDQLVGIDGQVEAIMDLLDYDFGHARCLGIHGPGGIGKTTLAKALYDKLISNFDQYCFLRNVSASSRRDGLVILQKKVLSNILGKFEPIVDINDVDDRMNIIREKVHDKKVLIVLDDVDHREQLEKLIGKITWFGRGSRVVITTRSKSILEYVEKIIPYELKEMNFDQALQLYMNHAFRRESPRDDHYDRLSRNIVPTFGGFPLVIEVIGSFLHGRDKDVWKDTLEKLMSIAHEELHWKLKISYDALNFKQKQIFLDIACFSLNEKEINASYIGKDHEFFPQTDIEVLSSLSLITIRENGGLWMHDLLKDLGRQIVRNENLDPGKHSRLWASEEAMDVVKTEENKGNIEALSLAGDPTLLVFTHEDFARLPNLRFLELDGGSFVGDFTNLFSKLQWFSWSHCPPDLIATNLFPQNLVALQLSEFNGTNDWEGWSQIKMLHNLKVLRLTHLNMVKIDLSRCFTLERLIIQECSRLGQIDHSIGESKRLAYLSIKGCNKLKYLPSEIGLLVNLTHLSLSHCSKLRELPGSIGKLNSLIKLDLSFTSIKELPHSVGCLVNLKSLSIAGCRIIRELPDSIGNLKSLIELDLSSTFIKLLPHSIGYLKTLNMIKMEHGGLAEFPSAFGLASKLEVIHAGRCFAMEGEVSSEIGNLFFLRILDLSYTQIGRVPETIGVLPHLQELILRNCNKLQMLPSLPTSLTHLLVSSKSLQSIPDLSNLTNLVNLLLSDGSEYQLAHLSSPLIQSYNLEWIGKLFKLENLHLCLRKITVLSTALGSLSRLRKLYISGHLCPKFLMQQHSSAMPENLSSITTFPDLSNLRNLVTLKLCRSVEKEIQLSGLEHLRLLSVRDFPLLEKIIISPSGLKNLKELELYDCPILIEIGGPWASETLENLMVELCPSIIRLGDLSRLPKLIELKIRRCDKLRVFESIDKLGCLSLFNVIWCPSLEYWTNASDTMIPDECQVVIQYCSILHDTPEGGMFYKNYRDKILRQIQSDSDTSIRTRYFYKNCRNEIPGRIKSDSDTRTSNRTDKEAEKRKPPSPQQDDGDEDIDVSEVVDMPLKEDNNDQEVKQEVAEMEENRQVASIEKDVGSDDQVNHILSLMDINEKDERIVVVIQGECGIGKTTLAKLVYNQVSCDFDGCSFLADIKETTQVLGGLQLLQTKLISDVLKRELEDVAFVNMGIEHLRDLFCNMRVLIILDDVENAFHVQKLTGDCFDCFASGSRILITTRNVVVLEESPQIRTYHVRRLDNDQALQLFRQHASMPTNPSFRTMKLLNHVLNSMAGLPLSIEVMGAVFNGNNLLAQQESPFSSLFVHWNFHRILKEGYRTLDNKQKQIFLDIACFTAGIDSRIAWYLWYDTSFLPSAEILTPLAKIGENNQIWMHSMLRQLGRGIVRGENLKDPGRRSRLFNHAIALDTIKQKKGTEKVEALCLNFQRHTPDKLTPEDFESMPNMRFLQLDQADIAGDFANLFPNLRWLRWQGCPRSLQVINFHLENLTILDLSRSKVTQDWEGWGQIKMQNLRVLNLTGCADLLVTPKFSGCQNLAILILERCSQLVKIDHSIGDLKCLVSLNLKFCTELSMLPVQVGHLTTLKELLMDGTSVQEIPISIGHLKQLETLTASNCFSLCQLSRTICHLTNISLLSLDGTKITTLPDSIGELVRLKHLSLRDCRRIRKLPNSIGNIGRSLVELDISGTGISKFPDSIKNLQNLRVLRMDSCFFTEFPPDIGEMTSLEEIHASWCRSLEGSIPSGIRKLHNLRILKLRYSSITSIPVEIRQLSNLQTLDLLHSNILEELPTLSPSKRIFL